MKSPDKRFPLNLSSIGAASKSLAGRSASPGGQTAARNAATDQANRLQNRSESNSVKGWSPTNEGAKQGAGRGSGFPSLAQDNLAGANGRPDVMRQEAMVSEGVRRAMVERIARQGVRDPLVLEAMRSVLRHTFIEPGLSGQAYIDASLPIGYHQTISQPYIVARMLELLRENAGPDGLDKVLEIGTGCGYQAAVLARVAREVYSIERLKPLHELAKNNLRPYRIANLRLQYGDGMLGLPAVAPFSGIILAAAGMEVPIALLHQLAIGGRLVAPVGNRRQVLQVIQRTGREQWSSRDVENCHFVPLLSGQA